MNNLGATYSIVNSIIGNNGSFNDDLIICLSKMRGKGNRQGYPQVLKQMPCISTTKEKKTRENRTKFSNR